MKTVATPATVRVADRLDGVLRAALLMGASDHVAVEAAIAQLELLFRGPLTRHYGAWARRTLAMRIESLRTEMGHEWKGAKS